MRDEEVASSKKNRNRAKIDTLFMTKMAAKWLKLLIPLGAAHTYIAHIREYPPGCKAYSNQCIKRLCLKITACIYTVYSDALLQPSRLGLTLRGITLSLQTNKKIIN